MFERLRALVTAPEPDHRWDEARRAPRHTDEALTGTARVWLRALPGALRPRRLCVAFPRVANRLAWSWHDPAERRAVLEDLLTDRRGNRRGFPRPVALELQRLHDFLRAGG